MTKPDFLAAAPRPLDDPPPWLAGVDTADPEFSGWDAYDHWKRWMVRHVDGAMVDRDDSFVDVLDPLHATYLYSVMCDLWDRAPRLTSVPLAEAPR